MDYFIGDILLFPFGFAPEGTLLCNGMTVSIRDYQSLFALIGTTYGGDGRATFMLPDLQDAVPLPGMIYCIVTDGIFPSRP